MELMGIADEASPSIEGQIRATKKLGWKWIEARFAEVDGCEKGPVHDIPDAAFDVLATKLEEAEVGVYALGSTICNWAKTIDTPWDVTIGEINRAIPRMQRLGTKYVRIMSFKPTDETDETPSIVFDRLREVTQRFLDEGLQPVHENCMNHGGMSWQHGLELLEKVPGLKWVFDTANPIFNSDRSKPQPWPKQDPWEYWQNIKEHTCHIHIKDCVWVEEKNDADYTFPGEGDGRVRDILKDAFNNGYDAGISIEPHMAVVFHDKDSQASEDDMFDNYVEYGQKLESLIDDINNK